MSTVLFALLIEHQNHSQNKPYLGKVQRKSVVAYPVFLQGGVIVQGGTPWCCNRRG